MPPIPATVRGNTRVGPGWRRLVGTLLLLIGLGPHLAGGSHAQDGAGPVFVVPIRGEIDLGLAPYLARVLEQAKRENARAVVLEIDTPGGRLDAALQMRHAIVGSPVRTVAFVQGNAYSAGALLAIAAHDLYLTPGAVVGAATPVMATGQVADEKAISAVRTMFKATAELRGRDPRVAEAMVDPAVEIDGLVGRGQLLTLTAAEARTWGYASGLARDRQELLQLAGLSGAVVHEPSPALAETVVRFLTSPAVASLLIALGFLLVMSDFLGGTLGIGTGAGVGLLALFFWGHMLAGLAGWEGVALVVLGLVLLGVEAFLIPGFGVAGVLGLLASAAGLFLSLIGGEIVTDADIVRAAYTVGFGMLATVVGAALLIWLLPKRRGPPGLFLHARLARSGAGSGGGPELTEATQGPPAADRAPAERRSLVGATGVAASDLRPGGIARIGGERVDVVTQGDYVRAGEPVEVVSDEGYRRVVRRLEREGQDAAPVGPPGAGEANSSEGAGSTC